MPIKRSALFFIALAVSSVSLLVLPSNKIIPVAKQAKPSNHLTEQELFFPWSMLSQSMLRTNV